MFGNRDFLSGVISILGWSDADVGSVARIIGLPMSGQPSSIEHQAL